MTPSKRSCEAVEPIEAIKAIRPSIVHIVMHAGSRPLVPRTGFKTMLSPRPSSRLPIEYPWLAGLGSQTC
jgi:hypothetical protein